ncbi:MAG: DUF1365 domain-containing protein [Hyphomicrobiaceae bacterium]
MTPFRSGLYVGAVAHKRLTPRRHAFSYRVFALCLDVDEIDRLHSALRLFSRNAPNVLSFWDRDFGRSPDRPVGEKARQLLADAGLEAFGHRIELVCYPRVLGYVFNPLSVYFCRDDAGRLGAILYEVTNTFGERRAYLIEVPEPRGPIAQACRKELYVSPFTAPTGTYSFHVRPPDKDVVIGVAFRDAHGPVLKTHFRAERAELSDRAILRQLVGNPAMTLKVIGAIHFEAARLWLKGVPLKTRYTSATYAATVVRCQLRDT